MPSLRDPRAGAHKLTSRYPTTTQARRPASEGSEITITRNKSIVFKPPMLTYKKNFNCKFRKLTRHVIASLGAAMARCLHACRTTSNRPQTQSMRTLSNAASLARFANQNFSWCKNTTVISPRTFTSCWMASSFLPLPISKYWE